MRARFHFHIRLAHVVDPDCEDIEIQADDCVAEAIAVARRIVIEALTLDGNVADMTFEITYVAHWLQSFCSNPA